MTKHCAGLPEKGPSRFDRPAHVGMDGAPLKRARCRHEIQISDNDFFFCSLRCHRFSASGCRPRDGFILYPDEPLCESRQSKFWDEQSLRSALGTSSPRQFSTFGHLSAATHDLLAASDHLFPSSDNLFSTAGNLRSAFNLLPSADDTGCEWSQWSRHSGRHEHAIEPEWKFDLSFKSDNVAVL